MAEIVRRNPEQRSEFGEFKLLWQTVDIPQRRNSEHITIDLSVGFGLGELLPLDQSLEKSQMRRKRGEKEERRVER